jgi:hypothetical protein
VKQSIPVNLKNTPINQLEKSSAYAHTGNHVNRFLTQRFSAHESQERIVIEVKEHGDILTIKVKPLF